MCKGQLSSSRNLRMFGGDVRSDSEHSSQSPRKVLEGANNPMPDCACTQVQLNSQDRLNVK